MDRMSVVKINAISIPEGMGPQLEGRFAGRAKMVEQFEGFEDFQLLRPVEGETRYFVYTRWETEEHFQVWLNSQEFGRVTPTPAVPAPQVTHRRRAQAGRPGCRPPQLRSRRTRRQRRLTQPPTPPILVCVTISRPGPQKS